MRKSLKKDPSPDTGNKPISPLLAQIQRSASNPVTPLLGQKDGNGGGLVMNKMKDFLKNKMTAVKNASATNLNGAAKHL